MDQKSLQVAVIGASGFVGRNLVKLISKKHSTVALTRNRSTDWPDGVEWRRTDLFSAQSTFAALRDVDTAIYLVHSMMPSSHLFQGHFHDTDLLLADNFARGCVANGVKRIIYLGGLRPDGYVSPHLQSRLEVEEVFKATNIPVTVLRAGMIVGPGGSSFEILRTLVQRLPFMILPEWTERSTQAIFIDDVVAVIANAIISKEFEGATFDVVNGETLNYKTLLKTMARILGRKRLMVPLPIRSAEFSKLWVQVFGNSSAELVSPLVDSLLCDLPQIKPVALIQPLLRYLTFEAMAQEALFRSDGAIPPAKKKRRVDKTVRSIQRLPSVPMVNCQWIAEEYMRWLPVFLPSLMRITSTANRETIEFFMILVPRPLLVLKYVHGQFDDDRQKFHIVGGLLSHNADTGWLEFRQTSHKKFTLAAIHDFVPSLPWPLYVITQAPLHKFVMKAFGRHLLVAAQT